MADLPRVEGSVPVEVKQSGGQSATLQGLTRRAGLTSIGNLIRQASSTVVNFVVTPVLIHGLGEELYGAWLMIQQTVGYLANGDLRVMGTLMYTLAAEQHSDDYGAKRRQIGAAVLIWLGLLPLTLAAAAALVYYSPRLIRTGPELFAVVRVALVVSVLAAVFQRVLSIPDHVLRGVNLAYKGMWLNAGAVALGGLAPAVAVWADWGIVGVAVAAFSGVLLISGVRFAVARGALPWFGASRPSRRELAALTKLSIWVYASAMADLLLYAGDILLIGLLLDPSAATVYATTGAVMRLVLGPITQVLKSASSGIGGLCGQGEWARVRQVRHELHQMAIGLVAVVGAGVILLNRQFLQLWVGEGLYAGDLVNLLLVLAAFGRVFYQTESTVIDGALWFRDKTWAMGLACLLFVAVGGLTTRALGAVGMAAGILAANLSMVVTLPLLMALRGAISLSATVRDLGRPVLVAWAIWAGAYALGQRVAVVAASWLSWGAAAAVCALVAGSMVGLLAFDRDERVQLLARARSLVLGVVRPDGKGRQG